jgi:membrane-associated phospholipid phosphatase
VSTLLALLAPLFAAAAPPGTFDAGFVAADGGTVPVVAPKAVPKVAPVLAPELVPDGGQAPSEPLLVPESLSVYNVDLPAEAAITAGSLALMFILDALVKPTLAAPPSCRRLTEEGNCDPADLNVLDRAAVGNNSQSWKIFSDIALGVAVFAPVTYLAIESITLPTRHPWRDFFDDALVVTEAMALTAVFDELLKFIVRRPRPINYVSAEAATAFDTQLSFTSGHTSMVAAATTALTTTVFMRHPTSKVRFLVLAAGVALSVLTGVARVEAGMHFPTDVITGWLTGTAAGFVVPFLHRKKFPVTPSVTWDVRTGTSMFALSGEL